MSYPWREMLASAAMALFALYPGHFSLIAPSNPQTIPSLPVYNVPEHVSSHLGAYAARYHVPAFGDDTPIPANLPDGCHVTQANILQRHGARFPTLDPLIQIQTTLDKLAAAPTPLPEEFAFLQGYSITFGDSALVNFGRNQSYILGQRAAARYLDLSSKGIFIRAKITDRVVESSRWFKQGFLGGAFDVAISYLPQPDLILASGEMYNNTLSTDNCPASKRDRVRGALFAVEWLTHFGPPIAARLNIILKPPIPLTAQDVLSLMALCGFETAFKNGTASPWCGVPVFGPDDWIANEYYYDLQKYYAFSYGANFYGQRGGGWVSELIARLTNTPVEPYGSVNITLDSDATTFPIGDNAPLIFLDYSSDNDIFPIFAALDILRENVGSPSPFPIAGPPNPSRHLKVSQVLSFAGGLVVERISCNGTEEVLVRILVNDTPVPINCAEKTRHDGMCELHAWVGLRKEGMKDWRECYE